MGMLGAMAGAGQGMQGFAGLMGAQRKMDWETQRDQVAHERSMNLENLRASNTRTLKEDEMKWRGEEAAAARAFTGEQAGELRTHQVGLVTDANTEWERRQGIIEGQEAGGYLDGVKMSKAEIAKLPPDQQSKVETIDDAGTRIAIDRAKKVKMAEYGMQDEVTKQQSEKLHATEMYKNADPVIQNYMDLNLQMNGKVDLTAMTKGTKLKAPTAEMVKLVMGNLTLSDDFNAKSPSIQMAIANQKALEIANPNMEKSGTVTLAEKDIAKTAKDLLKGKINATELSKLSPETYTAVMESADEIAMDTPKPRRAISDNAQKGLQYMKDSTKDSGVLKTLGSWYNRAKTGMEERRAGAL